MGGGRLGSGPGLVSRCWEVNTGQMSRSAAQAGPHGGSWSLHHPGTGVTLPPSVTSWNPSDPRIMRQGWRAVCGKAHVLRQALGQAGPQPSVCAQARPPGGAGRPGLAPWRPQRLADGALLGARGCPRLQPASHGAAPAAGRHAHAALAPLLAVRLALCPLMPVAGPAGLG